LELWPVVNRQVGGRLPGDLLLIYAVAFCPILAAGRLAKRHPPVLNLEIENGGFLL
jgi:hypothetical protein